MTPKTIEINRAAFMSMHDMMQRLLDTFDNAEAAYQQLLAREQQNAADEHATSLGIGAVTEAHPLTVSASQPATHETQLEAVALTVQGEDEPDEDDWSEEAIARRFGANGFGV